jgi:hypothetical protein
MCKAERDGGDRFNEPPAELFEVLREGHVLIRATSALLSYRPEAVQKVRTVTPRRDVLDSPGSLKIERDKAKRQRRRSRMKWGLLRTAYCKKGEGFNILPLFDCETNKGELKPYLDFFSAGFSGAAVCRCCRRRRVRPPGAGAIAPPGADASGAGGAAGAGAGGGGGGSSFFPHPAKARVKINRVTNDHEATRFPILVHLLSTTQEPACYEVLLHKFTTLARGLWIAATE